jgi:hypothetical protein
VKEALEYMAGLAFFFGIGIAMCTMAGIGLFLAGRILGIFGCHH